MYETSDIRKGLKIEMDGQPFVVVDFLFVKPGKGTAFTRTKLKNLMSGSVLDRTFRTGEKLKPADVAELKMQYLYLEGGDYVFMDLDTYDMMNIPSEVVGDASKWLLENMDVQVLTFQSIPVSVEVPTFVQLEIVQTDPGVKGNTAQGGSKPATLATGAVINVPLFVDEGTIVKVDTRTGDYVERVRQ